MTLSYGTFVLWVVTLCFMVRNAASYGMLRCVLWCVMLHLMGCDTVLGCVMLHLMGCDAVFYGA